MTETKLAGSHLRIAENVNGRVSRFRTAMIKTKHSAAKRRVEEAAEKRFKVRELQEAVMEAQEALHKAEATLSKAESKMFFAVRADMAKLGEAEEKEIGAEMVRSTRVSLSLLAASLPPDISKMLMVDETKKLLTAETVKEAV